MQEIEHNEEILNYNIRPRAKKLRGKGKYFSSIKMNIWDAMRCTWTVAKFSEESDALIFRVNASTVKTDALCFSETPWYLINEPSQLSGKFENVLIRGYRCNLLCCCNR
jgi:hypothetical protein